MTPDEFSQWTKERGFMKLDISGVGGLYITQDGYLMLKDRKGRPCEAVYKLTVGDEDMILHS